MRSLLIKSGPLAGRRVELVSQLIVGRAAADLEIDDPRISRRHALFRSSEETLEVEDLGSSNGTWVNGERISDVTRLRSGDVVELGGTVIEVELEPLRESRPETGRERPALLPTQIVTRPESAPASLSTAGREPEPPAEADEIRPVTALFADVVGSTAIGERLSPEEVKALIGECVSRMARAVEQFGGHVDAFMGDGIAAFFGVPAAHEDDPERAARAALRIVQVVDEYARDIETAWGIADFNVRVGLNSGQIALGLVGGTKRQSVALGDATNVAARLQAIAAPGSIVVGGPTAKRLADHFLLEELGEATLKGRTEPVATWRLLRPKRGPDVPLSVPLAGRDAERSRLSAIRDDVLAGRGQALLLLGDAGIGKTRLLSELRGFAGDAVTWLEGTCVSYGDEFLLSPVVEALRDWLGLEEGDALLALRTRLRIKLETLLGPRLADVLPQLESLVSGRLVGGAGTVGEDVAQDIRRACCAWIEGLCELRPVVFVLEDLQWADPWTCALAQDLLEIVDRAPLLLATSLRIAPDTPGWNFRMSALADHPHRVVELPVGPLSDADANGLLSLLMPGGLSEEARVEIIARAEGNPFYLEQLLHAFVESGGLEHERAWTLSPSATGVVPVALEGLLLARIDNLPKEVRRLSQTGAVIGRSFSVALLRRVHWSERLDHDLSTLVRAGVLRELRRYPEREYSFTHGLLREAALSTLTRARRRELYGVVAAALEELFAESLEEHLELLAHYYGRSDDLPKALAYLERAAERADRLSAEAQAAQLWRRAGAVAAELGDAEAKRRIAGRLRTLVGPDQ